MNKKVYKSPTVECREIGLTPILTGSTKTTGGDFGTGSSNIFHAKSITITLSDGNEF